MTVVKRITCHVLQETKKCLDAGRGQSMDLLYVAPCQNIPSQVEFPPIFSFHSCCFPRCGTLTTISTNSTITPASKPTALACLPQPCDTHKRLLPPSSSCGKPVTCSWRYIRDLRGSQYLSSSLNSCDTLAKFIVDPLIVVNQ